MNRLPRLVSPFAASLLLAGDISGQAPAPPGGGEIIVKFHDSVSPSRVAVAQSAVNASHKRTFAGGERLLRVRNMTVDEAIARLSANPSVAYAEPNYTITIDATTPNDSLFGELYGLNNTGQTGGIIDADVDAPEAWDIQTGTDVLIFVIDTGIDWSHPDLAANVWTNTAEIPDNGIDDDANGYVDDVRGWDFHNGDNDPWDDNGHGTHVSGILAAVGNNGLGVTGVCWSARLVPLKAIGAGGRGTLAAAIEALDYAVAMGARITNNSWGSTDISQALADAVTRAEVAGTLVIAAAGNSRVDADVFANYPAGYPNDNVISVANTNAKDELSLVSNHGSESVDLGAPGESILSTLPRNQYGFLTGTSMATPLVAGAAALILAEAPLTLHADIKATLLNTVDPISALTDITVTGGRLNIARALATLDSVPPSSVDDLAVATTGSNTVTLTWTAGGDDGDTGTAAALDIRYATEPVTTDNYESAARAIVDVRPQPAGATEVVRIAGLASNTTYHFAMRTLDERLNASQLSNGTSGTTLGPAAIYFSPAAISDTLLTGAASSHVVHISNTGAGTLDFTIPFGAGDGIRAAPSSATVAAGDTVSVAVTIDALGFGGGRYTPDIIIASNAAGLPEVRVATDFFVTSAPHAVLLTESIDFGDVFVGVAQERVVRIENAGDQLLTGNVAHAPNDVAIIPDVFSVAPADTVSVRLVFAPGATGFVNDVARITTNDPDGPALDIPITGTSIPPPRATVSPKVIIASLPTGGRIERALTISNDGGSPLDWWVDTADTSTLVFTAGSFRNLGGVRVLFDQAHRNLHWVNWILFTGDVQQRGVKIINSKEPFTPEMLAGFDIVWMTDLIVTPSNDEMDALADWVRGGGGLLLEGDNDRSVVVFNDILDRLRAGLTFSTDNGVSGITLDVAPHETTNGVADVFLRSNTASIVVTRRPASVLVRDVGGIVNTAFALAGSGRIIVTADETFSNNRIGKTGNLAFANRVFDWLSYGVGWLDTPTRSGTLAPGESAALTIRLDATNIDGGNLAAEVIVNTNDPLRLQSVTPTLLSVQPAADIVVTPQSISFPATAIERSVSREVWISNIGSQPLAVSHIIAENGDITATPAETVVPVGATQQVLLTFAPASAGASSSPLYVISNDPVDGAVTVATTSAGFVGTPGTRTIELEVGTNLVSWNIDTRDDGSPSILSEISEDIVAVTGYEGRDLTYTPNGLPQQNTLTSLSHLHAYWIEAKRPRSIRLDGFVVGPQTPLALAEGLNTISYLPQRPDSLTHALASIIDNVSFVAAYDGEDITYDPVTPEESALRVMRPGFGYLVVMGAPDTLRYPTDPVVDKPDTPDTPPPVSTALFQNFPNPFNPNTTIRFALDRTRDVALDIYNVRGQHVIKLIRERRNAGEHDIDWNGRNGAGTRVASGVYFYRLRAGEFVATRKMVLIE